MISSKRIFAAVLVLTVIASVIIGALRAEQRKVTAMLQIKSIERIEPGGSEDEFRVVLRDHDPIALSSTKDREWVENALEADRPIAVNALGEVALPTTIAFILQRREISDDEEISNVQMSIFAPPRPAQLYVEKGTAETDRLVNQIEKAIDENQGAILAIRDAFWIEDMILISPQQAMQMQGIGSK